MKLRRGFKAEADRIAVALRADLGLRPFDPMDLQALARRLDVPVVPLSTLKGPCKQAVRQLCEIDPGAFSAITLPDDAGGKFVLHNDAHTPARQRRNIAHEFSHVLLRHEMTLPLDATGCRKIDKEVEDEANWLSGAILVPAPAALFIV